MLGPGFRLEVHCHGIINAYLALFSHLETEKRCHRLGDRADLKHRSAIHLKLCLLAQPSPGKDPAPIGVDHADHKGVVMVRTLGNKPFDAFDLLSTVRMG